MKKVVITNDQWKHLTWLELPYEVKQEWYGIYQYGEGGKRVFPHDNSSMHKYVRVDTSKTAWYWVKAE